MRRIVSNSPAGRLFNAEQPKKHSVNFMLDVFVPIAENSFSGSDTSDVHSANVPSKEVISMLVAKSVSGISLSDLQPTNISFTVVTFVQAAKSVAGICSNATQSANVELNCVV